jgi:hypothetical protein
MEACEDGDEGERAWEQRAIDDLNAWFDRPEVARVGVLLVEPQWGSSLCAQPWPPKVSLHSLLAGLCHNHHFGHYPHYHRQRCCHHH